jgi:Diadenosine tetraphosphate (Ap4A) hydrolase and other HIT family hydrolases
MEQEDCIFCKIIAGEIPSTFVYQDESVVAFKDINPAAPQHILFVPKKHIVSMAALTPEDGPILNSLFQAAKKVAHDLDIEEGYRFLTNVGPLAGQSVMHLHFHLLGGREMKWPPG